MPDIHDYDKRLRKAIENIKKCNRVSHKPSPKPKVKVMMPMYIRKFPFQPSSPAIR